MDSTGRPSSNDDKISDSTNRIHSNLKLLDGEKVYERITPHFLSFYNLYLVWIYIIFLSVLFILYYDTLVDNMEWFTSIITNVFALPTGNMGILSGVGMFDTLSILINVVTGQTLSILHAGEYALAVLWLIPIALFSTAFSILRIEWKWIAVMIGVGLASIMIMVLLELPGISVYYISIILSLLGCLGVDLFRRAHRFYVTNYRIITELKFLGLQQNTLSYDKINNLIVDQSLVGRIFNFGTLIPVTASGLGMGEDSASVSVGGGGRLGGGPFVGGAITGGRSIDVPRTRSQYALFGVSNPQKIYNLLSKFMQEYVEAPYLKDMSENLRKMLEQQKELLGEKDKK